MAQSYDLLLCLGIQQDLLGAHTAVSYHRVFFDTGWPTSAARSNCPRAVLLEFTAQQSDPISVLAINAAHSRYTEAYSNPSTEAIAAKVEHQARIPKPAMRQLR